MVAPRAWREKAVSLVRAGGLLGAIAGPNLAAWTRTVLPVPFVGAYLALASVAAARAAGSWYLLPRLPAVIAAFHLGYGWGTWQGLWDVLRKRTPAQRFARITR